MGQPLARDRAMTAGTMSMQTLLYHEQKKEGFALMPSKIQGDNGIQRLIRKYKRDFRIQENLEHYSGEDYERAERGYVQFCLKCGGSVNGQTHDGT